MLKLLQKAPLKYKLVHALSCLEPRQTASNLEVCVLRMKTAVKLLDQANRIPGGALACEEVVRQWRSFLENVVATNRVEFAGFVPTAENCRVDTLLYRHLAKKPEYEKLWKAVVKNLLISHGQASVERGFSVKRQLEVENLLDSFVAQRLIADHVRAVGGVFKVVLSKDLLVSASVAQQRYMRYLNDQKKNEKREGVGRKRKVLDNEIDAARKWKKFLEDDA